MKRSGEETVSARPRWWTRVPWGLVTIIAIGLALRLWVAPSLGYFGVEADLFEQKQGVHRGVTEGFHAIYDLNRENDPGLTDEKWNGGYFIDYPPAVFYLRVPFGYVYRAMQPQVFELWDSRLNFFELIQSGRLFPQLQASRGYSVAIKLPAILIELVIAIAAYFFLLSRRGTLAAHAAAAACALNPALIYDTAHWGQFDSVWVAFVLLAFGGFRAGRVAWAWAWLTLAVLTKQQAIAFLPFFGLLTIVRYRLRGVVSAAGVALLVYVAIGLPFLLHGKLLDVSSAVLVSTFTGDDFISSNALNVWWLFYGLQGAEIHSSATVLGGFLAARDLGIALVLGLVAAVIWRLQRSNGVARADDLLLAGTVQYLGFFVFATNLHENHLYFAVLALCFLAPADRRLWPVFAIVSLTLLQNMAFFDPPIMQLLDPDPKVAMALASLGAALNGVALVIAGWVFWVRTRL